MRRRKFNFYSAKTLVKYRKYASFDGVNDYILIDNNTSASDNYTITFSFKIDPISTTRHFISTTVGSGNKMKIGILSNNNIQLRTRVGGPISSVDVGFTNDLFGKWNTLTIVRRNVSDNNVGIRLNKNPYVLLNQGTGTASNWNTVGRDETGIYFSGDIRELKIWDKALNEDEAAESTLTSYTSPQPNLVCYYKFDGNALDSSGNNRHGTEFNGVKYLEEIL
ncbi:LamG domain-containing protein [Pontibacter qinzhouensis]|uniref:LamG domain-containing protein n=1 Tax=Pontibacter qinzhouensis TaxID=2603253 RepID=A0A5C8JJC9_9BACT|nr:LamG-like jellyroll fold domain-containing protein [Pontibacter qinzhouensis]TXK36794.1 LamG domain-containing protein [Pontibacter qinzhouensis]